MLTHTIRLVKTSTAYPEQYDAYVGEKRVAYFRLRGGMFTVKCPHIEDVELGFILNETVHARYCGDGEFYSETQRRLEFEDAKAAVDAWLVRNPEFL